VRRGPAVAATVLTACLAAPAMAQGPVPDPPGPYVVDVRAAFGRGLGVDLGAHVYAGHAGAARFGIGAAYLRLPGDSDADADPAADPNGITAFAPQLSLNFGSSAGWSYLSAGYGRGRVGAGDWGSAASAGGGARWFLTGHAAVGFDLRYHRLPDDRVFVMAVGVSVK
jgi:hypothetical protein